MPSNVAQQRLICETYARAGLDATKDRCQFFEAHGKLSLELVCSIYVADADNAFQ